MTAKELAALLNGRERGNEITKEEETAAKEAGLVVVFGESDDCMEFRGAIDDEVSCFDGGMAYVNEKGLFESPDCTEEYGRCEYVRSEMDKCATITALWDAGDFPWSFDTGLPYETFEIFEDGEKYCQGIVFSLADLKAPEKHSAKERGGLFAGLRELVEASSWPSGDKELTLEFITDLEEATNHAG